MVGHADGAPGGAESAVIKWNPVLGSGVPTFISTNMLIKDGQPLDTPLTYKLKWLAQDADADATAALQVGQTLPLPSADGTSVWDPNDGGPGGVGIDCSNGDIFATPERSGTYVAWLIAADANGPATAAACEKPADALSAYLISSRFCSVSSRQSCHGSSPRSRASSEPLPKHVAPAPKGF